jgi:hypothetical protein
MPKLAKKYIKQAGGDLKKAWALQRRAKKGGKQKTMPRTAHRPKGKSRRRSAPKRAPSPKRPPGIGASYAAGRAAVLSMAPLTHEVALTTKDNIGTLPDRTIERAFTGAYAANLAVLAADAAIDRKAAQSGALSRGSVTAWLPEAFVMLRAAEPIISGGISRDSLAAANTLAVRTTNGYDVGAGALNLSDPDFVRYRTMKHVGQVIRIVANRTSIGRAIARPLKKGLRVIGATA